MSANGLHRNLPGTSEEECSTWTYTTIHPAHLLSGQEYLQSQLRLQRFNIDALLTVPPGLPTLSWLYEHMRQICIELGFYITQLHHECTPQTCSIMRANETTYYCAGNHGHSRACSAISYSVHTLDFAMRQLSSSVTFGDRRNVDKGAVRHFQSMVRRLYRVFAHAYFHHRELFERLESTTFLYARFVRLARKYELAPESQIIIPDLPTTC